MAPRKRPRPKLRAVLAEREVRRNWAQLEPAVLRAWVARTTGKETNDGRMR